MGIIAVAAVAFIIYTMVAGNRTKFYDDESTTGNTSGNLLNGGLNIFYVFVHKFL